MNFTENVQKRQSRRSYDETKAFEKELIESGRKSVSE